jgi:hypothetical protein
VSKVQGPQLLYLLLSAITCKAVDVQGAGPLSDVVVLDDAAALVIGYQAGTPAAAQSTLEAWF